MFDKKKDDNSNEEKSVSDVFRPAKGNAKVIIGHGVTITVKLKKQMRYKLMVKLM